MGLIIWASLCFFPAGFAFDQNEYEVIFERAEVVRFNKTYVVLAEFHNFKYNRTHAAVNGTHDFNVALGNELQLEVQAYKFYSNEFRLFPLRFSYNYCGLISKNEFGMAELYNCGRNRGCPLKKAAYHTCNWMPDVSKYPPNVPSGRYMTDLKYFLGSVEVMFLQAYIEIKYPEVPGLAVYRG